MTLIELLIAMSIVILIATISFPTSKIEKYKINSFTKQLCCDVRYVRRKNMLGDKSTYIVPITNSKYSGYVLKSNKEELKKNKLPLGTKITFMLGRVRFRIDGSPDPKGTTIRIMGKRIYKELTIVPVSGRTLLKEGRYEK